MKKIKCGDVLVRVKYKKTGEEGWISLGDIFEEIAATLMEEK